MAPNRRSPVAPVLFVLLLAVSFGLAGCARAPEEAPKPTTPPKEGRPPKPQEVTVHVTLDTSTPDAKPMPSIDPVILEVEYGQVAHWILAGEGQLKISMKKENPFEGPFEEAGSHVRSGKPRKDAAPPLPPGWKPGDKKPGKHYSYTITVTVKGKPYTNDPDVEIQP